MKATALVLDVAHRGRALTADVPDGMRPLAALARESWPLGHRLTETEGEQIGVPFTDDAELFHEYFRVLRVLAR